VIRIRNSVTATAIVVSLLSFASVAFPQSPSGQPDPRLERSISELMRRGEYASSDDSGGVFRNGPALEEYEFTRRFKGLLGALLSFADTYNSGHIVDAEKAKAVRRALRELEKSEWFNPRKADN
jgi:hypothetical protein